MPLETLSNGIKVIRTKVLGVTNTYKDVTVQQVLRHMASAPKEYLIYVLKGNVYALRGTALIFIGKVKSDYDKEFEECPEPIVKEWKVTGGTPGKFSYGLNLELVMKNVNDTKGPIILPPDEDIPF